ncbi:ABC transporter ATP-binding protein [Parvularcula flava]|uniref:ABC transporter ATP-binding protein n=1 Tax=Aquisalinus luteolus TaxID=1566827 RepID=A0A8J3A3S2_9PROT|nr:ABC transporter ATP-binding protein [Aquisalinus luteolus]NHK27861.1 ABC transporter ATP-binding protein [Aquisalinus luteolus]GGH96726.1 multidrug ABC transporter ATP-binding protein [Aquisalinus luteolus]
MWFRWFEKAVSPFPDEHQDMPPKDLLAFTWHYTKPFRWLLVGLALFSAGAAVVEVAIFNFLGSIVDWLAGTDPSALFAERGTELVLIGLVTLIVWPLFGLISDTILHNGLLGNYAMQIRWRAHRFMLRQSTQFFTDDFAGRLTTKVMQTALGVRDAVVKVTNLFVYVAVYFIGAVILFASADPRLAAPILIWLVAYFATMRHFLPQLRDVAKEQADARSALVGRIVDAYTNIQTVKMFSSGRNEEAYARDGMEIMLDTVYRQMRQVTGLSVTLAVINAALIAGTLGLGLWLWSQGLVQAGALAVAGALLMRIQGMSHWFIFEVAGLFESIGSVQDGIETVARPIKVADVAEPKPFAIKGGAIAFDKVGFHYGKGSGIIENLSLDIAPGEKVGLVGRSGAGKSTLVSLLLRLYDVEKGRILIDGQDISQVRQDELRRAIAVVSQDTSLLHRSIYDNIAYGREDATMEMVENAARLAEAADFIPDLVDGKGRKGYDAHVGERGVKLSGGQRQRIAIARLILKNAPILILDEATSALDSEVELAIQTQLQQLMAGKTVLAIAHRLSTIAAMDRLIVIDRGRIVEQGSHRELVERGGIYADLWAHQSGGFIGADEETESAAE